MNYYCKKNEFGFLTIFEENGYIIGIKWIKKQGGKLSPLLKNTFIQLEEYFQGKRFEFNIPYSLNGTVFQNKVWRELLKIPYGETRTYKEIAIAIGNSNACRAVGMANNKNPIAIIIPCHRVIGVNGKLTGYAGGLDKKDSLLQLERASKIQ